MGLEDEVLPVTRNNKAAGRRLLYTQQNGLVDVPSDISWLFRTKPPFSRPLIGMQSSGQGGQNGHCRPVWAGHAKLPSPLLEVIRECSAMYKGSYKSSVVALGGLACHYCSGKSVLLLEKCRALWAKPD